MNQNLYSMNECTDLDRTQNQIKSKSILIKVLFMNIDSIAEEQWISRNDNHIFEISRLIAVCDCKDKGIWARLKQYNDC